MACIGEGPIYILSLCKEGFPWGSAGKRICLQFRTPGFDGSLGWGGLLEKREATHSRGWDGWMASPIWWMWVWVSSGSWWWTGKSGVLQSMGSQRVGHDWVTELNWFWSFEVIPQCSFDLNFSNKWCWASFHVLIGHLYIFFGKMSI